MPETAQHLGSGAAEVPELKLLLRVSQILESSLELRQVLGPVLEAITEFLNLKHSTVTLLNRETGEIHIESGHGLSVEQREKGRYQLGEGITGRVVETGMPAIIQRVGESAEFVNRTNRVADGEFSFVCVPIRVENEVLGALSADSENRALGELEENQRVLSIIASMIAQAVKLRREAAEQRNRLQLENERLKKELSDRFRPSNIVGNSREMQAVYDQVAQVSQSSVTVTLLGETGTGKELVARAIHYNSPFADQPFIAANCAALNENLIESELFGHAKGSFTGAASDRKGRFELADGGTIFLDEVGELPPSIQIKLLRVLQEREFEPVGSSKTVRVNVRVISASNRDLQRLCEQGSFRQDLLYRLNVFQIFVPTLASRRSDITLLADHFLEKYAKAHGKNVSRLSSAAIDMLYSYHWPGNVRELENVIERAVVLSREEVIHPHHLPPTLQTADTTGTTPAGSLNELVERYERGIIGDALKSARGNVSAAARILKTTPRILAYKVAKYGLNPKKYSS